MGQLVGDGGHTIMASVRISNINQLKTIRMSRSFVVENNINDVELRQIGLMMNPISKVKKKETEEDDAIKQLYLFVVTEQNFLDLITPKNF